MSLLLKERLQPLRLLVHLLYRPRFPVVIRVHLQRLVPIGGGLEILGQAALRPLQFGIDVVVVREAISCHFARQDVEVDVGDTLT